MASPIVSLAASAHAYIETYCIPHTSISDLIFYQLYYLGTLLYK